MMSKKDSVTRFIVQVFPINHLPRASNNPISAISICVEKCEDISITGVNDNAGRLITGVAAMEVTFGKIDLLV